jgi:hypothetical protein
MNTPQENVITRLPHNLCPAFIEWCARGGHQVKIKKDRVLLLKNGKRGEIFGKRGLVQETYAMNEYMIDRFYLFSLQWLKYGKQFVNELDSSMMSKYVEVHRQIGLAKVA